MALTPFFLCFGAAYLLSYFFRNVNAVISPELTASLEVTPGTLGLLTSAYFVAFGLIQIPVGMLLDRFGPRRVEAALLMVAGTGALIFAVSDTIASLAFARALIGLGSAACLMAPLKGLSIWFAPNRQPSLAGWMMVAGGLGALLSTAPLELALHYITWRTIFVVLAVATFAAAGAILRWVPDEAPTRRTSGWQDQWKGVREVFSHPRFWWIAPLVALGMGSFMAIQGLWSIPWMMQVNGFSREEAARYLLVVSITLLIGYVAVGLFATPLARRGISAAHLFAAGFGINLIALAVIVSGMGSASYVTWVIYGGGVVVNVLGFTVLNHGFHPNLAGRSNTAMNLVMFACSFAVQWGIGIVAELLQNHAGISAAEGLRMAFALVLIVQLATFLWFLWGWRRFAHVTSVET